MIIDLVKLKTPSLVNTNKSCTRKIIYKYLRKLGHIHIVVVNHEFFVVIYPIIKYYNFCCIAHKCCKNVLQFSGVYAITLL